MVRRHVVWMGDFFTPGDNPLTADKIELGRRLFLDRRLSADGRVVVRIVSPSGTRFQRRRLPIESVSMADAARATRQR